ncbi:helix-turn-helix domain-containing protein [Photobacterium sp. BZF1]|uniref:helix-turn-helix domain-containing protein n=1 Tax=Photobacterium sp. BZF1 TaxID=1904457 RepID=UPI0016534D53|nr:helix-turn-helix domain-containing protein [Photobacterium sp. BZF1]MBC7006605.1 helix-turn-helix domain-containing protein [Photobacterium sp. BZF1]
MRFNERGKLVQPVKPVRLILGEPCRAIDSPIGQDETYNEPHRHEYWEIVWCQDDYGKQSIDFVEYPNKAGRFFTITPGQVHQSDMTSNNVRLLVFAHGFVETNKRSTQLVDSVFSIRGNRLPYLDCDQQSNEYLLPIFTLIQEECVREDCDWALVESLINCFLRYLLRYSTSNVEKGEERDPRVGQVIELIDQHYKTEKSCQFYADALAITNKRINEIVKAELGKTVTQLIHDRVILEANRDLAFSNKTIKTIALELGFADPAYFSRFYRSNMKESPAQFRLRCVDSATL